MNLRRALAWCVAGGTIAVCVAACSSSPATTEGAKGAVANEAVEAIVHEPCEVKGHKVEALDTHADGKPVVTKVFDDKGHELCRMSDLTHRGRPDLYEYFDGAGTIRRREADYDLNGTIDSIEFYEGGKLVKREYDTTGQHRVDTWDYFDKVSGKRVRRERDTTNDGKVDQWWTWDGDKITIAVDRNGDGQPDPGATLVLEDKNVPAKDAKTAPPPPAASPAAPEGPPAPESPIDSAVQKSQPAASGSSSKPSSPLSSPPASSPSGGGKK